MFNDAQFKIGVAVISLVLPFCCLGCRSSGPVFGKYAAPVFVNKTHYGIYAYQETVTEEQLARAPLWKGGTNTVPLSSAQAEQRAVEYAKQTFENAYGWKISKTRLADLGKSRWIYVITVTSRIVDLPSQGFTVNPDVELIVLMDGFVVPLVKLPENILDIK
jgi:hypothetical protein